MSAPSQADILAALQSQGASRARNPPTTVTHDQIGESLVDGDKNARKLYCPREGCSCLIIGPGAATHLEGENDLLPTESGSPFKPTTGKYWHVKGSPFAFDNIGFSKTDGNTAVSPNLPGAKDAKGNVKWLICAECDLGPLGWSFEGGDEAWLAVDRLRYSAN